MAGPSVRNRLVLSFLAILALFALNQAISIWSDHARSQAFGALNRALNRRALTVSVRQQLADLHREVTLLGQVRFEPGSVPDPAARQSFDRGLSRAATEVHELKSLSAARDSVDIAALESCFTQVAGLWKKFYEYLG